MQGRVSNPTPLMNGQRIALDMGSDKINPALPGG
jgi:hypothetical protein